jgi:FkbM family methyltransferase
MADPLALLSRYIRPGSLVFDIGAHEGKHTAWLLELGARVVAVEPQPIPIAAHERLTVIRAAVSDRLGYADFWVAPGHEYVSTMAAADGYLEKVQTHAEYAYNEPIRVPTITLDALVEDWGIPVFAKIDVEGHERAVFRGLSDPLPALSFEVHDFDLAKAEECLAQLALLGDYDVFFCGRESFEPEPWPAAVDIFGDIYAVLK